MVNYLDQLKEERAGVSKASQGLTPEVVNRSAANSVEQLLSKADQRIELYARVFAETTFEPLFRKIQKCAYQNFTKPQIIRLEGKYTQVDPREWADKYDSTVLVGLGTGSQQARLAGMAQIGNIQKEIAMAGMSNIVSPKNIYRMAIEAAKQIAPKQAELFFTDPESVPPPQPQPDPKMITAQASLLKAQNDQQKIALTTKQRDDKMAINAKQHQDKQMLDTAEKAGKARLEAERQMLEREKAEFQAYMEREKLELERQRLNIEAAKVGREISREEADDQLVDMNGLAQSHQAITQILQELRDELKRPIQVNSPHGPITVQ
jgi:hypothetical protein